jgi:hypothetical protein
MVGLPAARRSAWCPTGHWGQRWARDVSVLLTHREAIVDQQGLKDAGGICLVWLQPWDGEASLPFGALDPWYIEICRRIRLLFRAEIPAAYAITTGSKASRIDAKSRNGLTGDPWMPIDLAAEKALTISAEGFHYRLAAELLFGNKFSRPVAQIVSADDGATRPCRTDSRCHQGARKDRGLPRTAHTHLTQSSPVHVARSTLTDWQRWHLSASVPSAKYDPCSGLRLLHCLTRALPKTSFRIAQRTRPATSANPLSKPKTPVFSSP